MLAVDVAANWIRMHKNEGWRITSTGRIKTPEGDTYRVNNPEEYEQACRRIRASYQLPEEMKNDKAMFDWAIANGYSYEEKDGACFLIRGTDAFRIPQVSEDERDANNLELPTGLKGVIVDDYLDSAINGVIETQQNRATAQKGKPSRRNEAKNSTPSCPDCGGRMKVREGKHGEFWGCTSYPTCRGTRQLSESQEPDLDPEKVKKGQEMMEAAMQYVQKMGGFARAREWISIVEKTARAMDRAEQIPEDQA